MCCFSRLMCGPEMWTELFAAWYASSVRCLMPAVALHRVCFGLLHQALGFEEWPVCLPAGMELLSLSFVPQRLIWTVCELFSPSLML